MMLSRIADSLFWIGRYMERADNTARILDVNYHMLLEQPPDTYKLRWDPLITITGERSRFYQTYEEADARTAFEFLGFSEDNPNSISQCIISARENARTIRDRISRELWEDINGLYHKINRLRDDGRRPFALLRCGEARRPSLPRRLRCHAAARRRLAFSAGGLRAGTCRDDRPHSRCALPSVARRPADSERSAQPCVDGGAEIRGGLRVLQAAVHARSSRRKWPNCCCSIRGIPVPCASISGCCRTRFMRSADRCPALTRTKPNGSPGRVHERLTYDSIDEIFAGGLHNFLEELQMTCRTIGARRSRETYLYYAVVASREPL